MREEIKNRLLRGKALGNSKKGLKEVCSDLLAAMDKKDIKQLEAMTYLSHSTIKRMLLLTPAESGADYRPQLDTCERILRVAGAQLSIDIVSVKSMYLPKPKKDD